MGISVSKRSEVWMNIAKNAVFSISILTVILFIISVPSYYDYIKNECISKLCEGFYNPPPGVNWLEQNGITASMYSFGYVSIYAVFGMVYISAGLILFWKKSTDLMGLLGTVMLISLGGSFPPVMESLKLIHPFLQVLLQFIGAGGMAAFILFFFLFPNGCFSPRWSAHLCFLIMGLRVPGMLFPNTAFDLEHWPKWVFGIWFFLWVGSLLCVQIYRYKYVMAPLEKQQAKWVVYGAVLALIGLMSITIFFIINEKSISENPYQLYYVEIGIHSCMLLIPIAILMAMMKRRLWDIDFIVNRTLVYGIMTTCTVAVYVLAVWYSGLLFNSSSHLFSSLIATGIVAVLFAPVKEKVQRLINRIMYGGNDDPYSVLHRLAKVLEDPIDPEVILQLVVRTIRESLRLPYAAISLFQNGNIVTVVEVGILKDELVPYNLLHRGEELGILALSRRSKGETFTSSDQKFIDMLVRQASVVVHSAKATMELRLLAADLQESRENLVLAREEERRKLRSNLHDDLAPRLAALALTAAAAEEIVESNPHTTKEILGELRTTIRQTVSEIRWLVYDLRPPTLDELGLIGAIHERIKGLSLPVTYQGERLEQGVRFTLNASEKLPALPAAIEVAAYRIATEAIVNVVRHSRASICAISILYTAGKECGLNLIIEDNGTGIGMKKTNSDRSGIGIGSMRERAYELGGTFRIESNNQEGTTITVFLPINSYVMGEEK